MSVKGKSKTRIGRRDIMRSDAANARRKQRQQARGRTGKGYLKSNYDGKQSEETPRL